MMTILNLDEFKEEIKEIQIKGKIYEIPSDIPTLLYFELLETSKGGEIENMRKGLETLYKVFKIKQPELTYNEYAMMITVDQYTAILNWVFADMSVEETKKRLAEVSEEIKDGKKKPLPVDS